MIQHKGFGENNGYFGHMVMPGGGEYMSVSSGITRLGQPVAILGWTTDLEPARVIDTLGGYVSGTRVFDLGARAFLKPPVTEEFDYVDGPTNEVLEFIAPRLARVAAVHIPVEAADADPALTWTQRRLNTYDSRRRHSTLRFEADGATVLNALGGPVFDTATVRLRDNQPEVMSAMTEELQWMTQTPPQTRRTQARPER